MPSPSPGASAPPVLSAPAARESELPVFAAAIRILRGPRPQHEVATAAGIHPAVWSLYERGRRQPRAQNLVKMLHGLGCSALEFEELQADLRRGRLRAGGEGAGACGDGGAPAEAVTVLTSWAQELARRFGVVLASMLPQLRGLRWEAPSARPGDGGTGATPHPPGPPLPPSRPPAREGGEWPWKARPDAFQGRAGAPLSRRGGGQGGERGRG